MKTIFLALVLALTSAVEAAPSLRDLQRGDRVRVQFHSQGCFHDYRYAFDFERGDTLVARSSAGRAVTLSNAQIAGLDRLIKFYRERREGLCTTQEDVTLTYFSRGRKFAAERYSDGTCAAYDMKRITTFRDIGDQLGLTPR